MDIGLSGSVATELSKHPISYEAGLTLFPGKYTIKFLARDGVTGPIGTYQTQFVIPNLAKERPIPLSSVVVRSQRVAMKYVLFSSKKGSGDRANPLFNGKDKLIPSVTRVFYTDKPMYVYLQAYQDADKKQSLLAAITLLSGDKQIFVSSFQKPSIKVQHGFIANEFQFGLPLTQIPAGRYICQVGVFDPTSHQVSFRQIPIVIAH